MGKVIFWYLVGVNLLAFCLFGMDKRKAIKNKWRISEVTLLTIAFFGGSMGAWIGMQCFRHKTKHWKFKILVPLFFIIQVTGVLYISMN